MINISINNCRPVSNGAINVDDGTGAEQNGPEHLRPEHLVFPPWFADHVLSVAAMTENGGPAECSIQGPSVSVAAPGTGIISLDPADRTRLVNQTIDEQGKQGPIQGTSFAAPYVAGLAALVRDRFENLSAKLE